MSVWSDIHRRSNGLQERKEDIIKEENSWDDNKWTITKSEIENLKKQQIKLNKSISDLRRELDRFFWNTEEYRKIKSYDL